jgi:Ser/Thr protein kinase RdoA (MazF antagonist)
MQANPSYEFQNLQPDVIFQALDAAGFTTTGQMIQLNSYENRVFEIPLEQGTHAAEKIVVKFYRPGRWDQKAILEEHEFLRELKAEGLPVVPPLTLQNNTTLLQFQNLWVAAFPKHRGRMPDEFLNDDLVKVGRTLAQIHNVGSRKTFKHRPRLGVSPVPLDQSIEFLASFLVPELEDRYFQAAHEIADLFFSEFTGDDFFRIHGDCHRGNLLKSSTSGGPTEFFFVDFDDCMTGPALQDVWMLLPDLSKQTELDLFRTGYEELREFPHKDLHKIPILRGFRIISYASWIAQRWSDPSFAKIFPEYGTYNYWAEEVEQLEKILRSPT